MNGARKVKEKEKNKMQMKRTLILIRRLISLHEKIVEAKRRQENTGVRKRKKTVKQRSTII